MGSTSTKFLPLSLTTSVKKYKSPDFEDLTPFAPTPGPSSLLTI